MPLTPGTRLGFYEITSLLGSGGMGQVYRAKDLKLGRHVAIKVLREELAADPERLRRFEQEARSASALNHPNIITIYDIGKHGDTPYIAMEYVEGKTLREMLAEGPLPTKKLVQLATQIAEGLAKAHSAGIVHRDLKPENLMVSSDGYVKILDFGLAKLLPQPGVESEAATITKEGTVAGAVIGTASYMSPEQALWVGRMSVAIPFMDRLRQVEPLDIIANWCLGSRHFYDGQYERALQEWRNLCETDPKHPGSMTLSTWQCWCAHALAYNQRIEEALAMIDGAAATNPNNNHTRHALMLKHALQGDMQGALEELTPGYYEYCRRDATWSHRIASDFAFLNAKEEALDWLENAVNLGHINYPFFAEKDLFLANLRGDPNFQQLMQRVKREWEEFEE